MKDREQGKHPDESHATVNAIQLSRAETAPVIVVQKPVKGRGFKILSKFRKGERV